MKKLQRKISERIKKLEMEKNSHYLYSLQLRPDSLLFNFVVWQCKIIDIKIAILEALL